MVVCIPRTRTSRKTHSFFYRNDARAVVVYTLRKKLVFKINKR